MGPTNKRLLLPSHLLTKDYMYVADQNSNISAFTPYSGKRSSFQMILYVQSQYDG